MKKSPKEGVPSSAEYYRSDKNKEAIEGVLNDPETRKLVANKMTSEEIAQASEYLNGEDSSEEGYHQLERLTFITYEILGEVDIPATMPKRTMGQSAKKPQQD